MSRQQKKLTKAERAAKAAKNIRRGRTPAYVEAKRWADRKLKPKPYSLPKLVEQRESGEVERILKAMKGRVR